ncbi:MAG: J domain-containing protein [Chloroflexi bacterium]|nr:J domain-containing protein [Chloroflexota bacterium]
MTKDYYKVLQVAPDAEAEVIQAVYRRLARKYHPDTGGDKASAEKMKLVNEAYAVLSDPASRTKYDRERDSSGERPAARASKTLVWQDDLHTKASGWPPPSKDEDCELDKRGGFLTIGVTRPNWMSVHDAPPKLSSFEAKVRAQIPRTNGPEAECGLVFCKNNAGHLKFSLRRNGYYSLSVHSGARERRLLDFQFSDLFNADNEPNVLMVKVVGSRIKIGVNGHLLASVEVGSVREGRVGLFVASSAADQFANAKFRDFTIYAIEGHK